MDSMYYKLSIINLTPKIHLELYTDEKEVYANLEKIVITDLFLPSTVQSKYTVIFVNNHNVRELHTSMRNKSLNGFDYVLIILRTSSFHEHYSLLIVDVVRKQIAHYDNTLYVNHAFAQNIAKVYTGVPCEWREHITKVHPVDEFNICVDNMQLCKCHLHTLTMLQIFLEEFMIASDTKAIDSNTTHCKINDTKYKSGADGKKIAGMACTKKFRHIEIEMIYNRYRQRIYSYCISKNLTVLPREPYIPKRDSKVHLKFSTLLKGKLDRKLIKGLPAVLDKIRLGTQYSEFMDVSYYCTGAEYPYNDHVCRVDGRDVTTLMVDILINEMKSLLTTEKKIRIVSANHYLSTFWAQPYVRFNYKLNDLLVQPSIVKQDLSTIACTKTRNAVQKQLDYIASMDHVEADMITCDCDNISLNHLFTINKKYRGNLPGKVEAITLHSPITCDSDFHI